MLNKRNKRIITCVLSIIFFCTLFGNAFAANEQNVYHTPSAENARINAEIISNFNKTTRGVQIKTNDLKSLASGTEERCL